MAESLWATLKRELVSRCRFASRAEARRAIIAWINRYNAVRLHIDARRTSRRSSGNYATHTATCWPHNHVSG